MVFFTLGFVTTLTIVYVAEAVIQSSAAARGLRLSGKSGVDDLLCMEKH